MLKMFSKRINNKKGFTLIELIVVIAILGILGMIAVPKFSGFTDKAKEQADNTSLATINNAIRIYCAEKGIDNLIDQTTGSGNNQKTITANSTVDDIIDFLKIEGLLESDAKLYDSTNLSYDSDENIIN
ncbi:type II secretion system protein [Crassaminicella thermophila]|uniref:type II secretion system protein n=1 Tax=Crassaminicella thermophila TaxID=2599308 RepID=UPI001E60F45F|nr:prepilin-type N-terminal cleavage/methylation domain-containing protein [Crassaminicella thermophila]